MRNQRGFTVVEMLVVVAILAILAGLTFPVMREAMRSAKVTQTSSNLRQQHLALKLYQADWGGDGIYGTYWEMGYPVAPGAWWDALRLEDGVWKSPFCCHPYYPTPINIQYWFKHPFSDSEVNQAFQENMLTFFDEHPIDHSVDLLNTFENKHVVGILLSGQLKNLKKRGNQRLFHFWAEPLYPVVEIRQY